MVRTGYPVSVFAEHAVRTDKHVLQRVGGGVPHVKGARDVGRRDNDNKRFFIFVGLSGKQFGVLPFFCEFLFYFLRFIRFG